jgi:hypothetical protein
MKYFLLNFLFYIFFFNQKKNIILINSLEKNFLNKNNIPIPLPRQLNENIFSKKTIILNKGIYHSNEWDDEDSYQEEINKIEQNFIKKKILEVLLDNSISDINKLELIEKYSFLFTKEKGFNKDFEDFFTS